MLFYYDLSQTAVNVRLRWKTTEECARSAILRTPWSSPSSTPPICRRRPSRSSGTAAGSSSELGSPYKTLIFSSCPPTVSIFFLLKRETTRPWPCFLFSFSKSGSNDLFLFSSSLFFVHGFCVGSEIGFFC